AGGFPPPAMPGLDRAFHSLRRRALRRGWDCGVRPGNGGSSTQRPCVGMRLLVTRPEADGARTAAALSARGHTVMVAPLLHVAPVEFALARQKVDAVVLTSANATHALAAHPARETLIELPAFTVGRHTAAAARAAGFGDVTSADGDKEGLAALLRARERK